MNEFLFLENTLPSNNHFLMQLGEGTVFNDLGPEGAISNGDGVVRACLAPYVKVSATQHAGPVKIETLENGLVAIRIDGYLTPHFFKVEDLSKFFRKDDESKSVWADFDPITKEISFFNKNPLVSAEVYIYQVDQVTSLKEIENEGFVPNDDFNLSYTALIGPQGISIAPK